MTPRLGRAVQSDLGPLAVQQGDGAAPVEVVSAQVRIGDPAAEELIRCPEDGRGDGDDRLLVAPTAKNATGACGQGAALRGDSRQRRFDEGGPEPPVPFPGLA